MAKKIETKDFYDELFEKFLEGLNGSDVADEIGITMI
jgi:hypothetical protein